MPTRTARKSLLTSLLAACKQGDAAAAGAILDWLEENDHGGLANYLRRTCRLANRYGPDAIAHRVENHLKALPLFTRLAEIDPATVEVFSHARRLHGLLGRRALKAQAEAARLVFRLLGLKGISVQVEKGTTCVTVILPGCADYVLMGENGLTAVNDPCFLARVAAVGKVEAVLAAAFPGMTDNSDYQSDYFDFLWSVAVD